MSCGCVVNKPQGVPTPPPAPAQQIPTYQQQVPAQQPPIAQQPVTPQPAAAVYTKEQPEISPKKGFAALLLVIFAGGLGAHRFYVGKIASGIAMLLVSLGGSFSTLRSLFRFFREIFEYGYYDDATTSHFLFGSLEGNLLNLGVGGLLIIAYTIWWLIDLITICISKFTDKQGRIVKL